ncbi:unnamed protein product [Brassica napus]|uniref:(rape) hypothetical protein n=1 Tax=Brassica napus TaxID=3708 RepID=A0A816M0X6_BRANA|nr:unnamed protein product [Brassica napus]
MNLTDFSMGFGSVFSLVSDRLVLVELFKHPHVLLLQYRNSIFKLPGGRLRPGESDIEGLKRKLASKLSVNENVLVSGLEVGECIGMWLRPNFETLMYPFLPPNVKHPKTIVGLSVPREYIPFQEVGQFFHSQCMQSMLPTIPGNPRCSPILSSLSRSAAVGCLSSIFFFSVQECLKLFLGRLALHQQFFVPKNFKLLAVPLSQIHENEKVKKY